MGVRAVLASTTNRTEASLCVAGPKEAVHGAFFEQHKKAIVQELIRRAKDVRHASLPLWPHASVIVVFWQPDTKPSILRVLLETLQATGQYLFMHKSGLVRPLIEYLWEKGMAPFVQSLSVRSALARLGCQSRRRFSQRWRCWQR